MPQRPSPSRSVTALALTGVLTLGLSACGDGQDDATSETTSASDTSSSADSSSTTSSPSSEASGSSSSTTRKRPAKGVSACAATRAGELSQAERAGQLLMVALQPTAGQAGLDAQISGQHIGGVIYLGGWSGAETVRAASAHMQAVADEASGIGLFVAADQEGGEIQQLRGAGFPAMPSGVEQGQMDPAALTTAATGWAKTLAGAGVNVNLAPVADVVPTSIGTANEPIGKWGRQYGSTPEAAATSSDAYIRGMLAGKVAPTVKHFPGIGRITGNTDLTASGVNDTVMTRDDAYLKPFASGIKAGASFVMVGSATYPRIDAKNPAVFSSAIVDGMLRKDLGYEGVVITDDVGVAKAVSATPPADRAVRFVEAGGDIVLTADPGTTEAMTGGLIARAKADEAFSAKVEASVGRVLTLKEKMGLLDCG
ncbi:glycoside hydrolase family 3 N-terminal domain-containing protein [Janibacter sp. G56]|uniref:glycoside hydrolase family 3 N-terminal domain-containing protein n=1 Tax=Janibacter sp. G56 TaxID=3418717 RepID=UPI003D054C81